MNKKQKKFIIGCIRESIISLLIFALLFYLGSIYGFDIVLEISMSILIIGGVIWFLWYVFCEHYNKLGD